ncbi:hypothetical protein [Methanosarcina lacustris]|uniref:hypothetical protein n=1 Tax=Methanosarcina lacustris TaxID=170861 RepID=UPI000A5554C9|nr:hypothetical protein [Methanosarcina lacustris]
MGEPKRSELIEFAVKYNGKAVESNEMDANAVATFLLGLSNAIETANSIINKSYL